MQWWRHRYGGMQWNHNHLIHSWLLDTLGQAKVSLNEFIFYGGMIVGNEWNGTIIVGGRKNVLLCSFFLDKKEPKNQYFIHFLTLPTR